MVGVEGIALLTSTEDLAAALTARGWTHTVRGDGRFTANPPAPMRSIRGWIEGGRLVSVEVAYATPSPARARGFGATLPLQREGRLLGSPVWGAFSEDRTVAVMGDGAGESVTAAHLGAMSNRREVAALIATYGAGLAPPDAS